MHVEYKYPQGRSCWEICASEIMGNHMYFNNSTRFGICNVYMKNCIFLVFANLWLLPQGFSQKGMPSKKIVTTTVTTHYPQHEDFKEAMLARLKVPAGFKVEIAASGLGKPRMMEMGADGSLYVTRRDQGDVLLLKDTDGDGRFDEMHTVLAMFKGVHGIAIKGQDMFLVANREMKRYKILADGSLGDSSTIVNDLPDGGQHPNRTMHFGPDGKLYLSVGSDCNDCGPSNPEHATMLIVDTATGMRSFFARGLRNTIGFDWYPNSNDMWGADNGSDMKGDELPYEELNKIVQDGHYGWPLVYNKQVVDETREDPPGTTKAAFAKTTVPDVMEFPAHSAPIEFKFLQNASGFPAAYRDDALVCWHGSWNRSKPQGYKVQRILFENGKPIGAEDFVTGFLSADGTTRFGRPAGLAVSPSGAVYISDDENGIIYKVSVK